MLKIVNREIQHLEQVLKRVEEIIKNSPEGKLRCAVNKGCFQYYSGKQYLGAEHKEYIMAVAQKEYCIKLEKELRKYVRQLIILKEIYEKESLEEQYRRLHPARKQLVAPLIKPVEEIIDNFDAMKYEGKGFEQEDVTGYFTAKGERVRSKSEMIIANELYRNKIPYHYEMPLELCENQRIIRIYPDYTALNKRTGKRWYIEHFGMMDKAGYVEKTMRKIDLYEKNGILLGRNLIILHETSSNPFNVNVLRQYMSVYLC